jgi:hypothetical protein
MVSELFTCSDGIQLHLESLDHASAHCFLVISLVSYRVHCALFSLLLFCSHQIATSRLVPARLHAVKIRQSLSQLVQQKNLSTSLLQMPGEDLLLFTF